MIRRHHCCCVIGRTVGIRYGERSPAKLLDDIDGDRVAGNPKPLPGEESVGPHLGVRERDERMQSASAMVPGQNLKTERTCEMYNCGAWRWIDARGNLGHCCIGSGDDDDVDADRGRSDRLPAT